jgi:hypothetical protein
MINHVDRLPFGAMANDKQYNHFTDKHIHLRQKISNRTAILGYNNSNNYRKEIRNIRNEKNKQMEPRCH